MKNIDFYFDYLSPYSYFAWLNHKKVKASFTYRPITMGSLFNHWEMKGPGEILPKRVYMLKQCFKYAKMNNIKFIPPKAHPFNPLYALRLSTNAINADQIKIIDILFNAVWGEGNDISDVDYLNELLKENDFDPKLIDKSFEKDVKKEIKENLKKAKEKMIFGVPSFTLDDELFWGNDTIADMQKYLEGNEPDWDIELFKERLKLN